MIPIENKSLSLGMTKRPIDNDPDDRQLRKLLQAGSHTPGENPWFTRRVLNRLPESSGRVNLLIVAVYLVALVICFLCWRNLMRELDFFVITVRDVSHFVALAAVTLAVLWQSISLLLRYSD